LDAGLLATNPNDFSLRAQELATLRYSWFDLHKYIKPAADAHTLESPVPLVAAMTARLRGLSGFENVRFAIVHTNIVNYFQLSPNYVRQLAVQISKIVDGPPIFPDDLAIVGLPYSQSNAVFLNTLLAHEMGHFSFQKRSEQQRLSAPFNTIFNRHQVASFSNQDYVRCHQLVVGWLEEIYCDLFAIRLAGPAFSYAFIEFFALTRSNPPVEFSASHPPLGLRLREQARLLQSSSEPWWPSMQKLPNHYTELLSQTVTMQDSEFSWKNAINGRVEQEALACFFEMLDEPGKAVQEIFGEFDPEVRAFSEQFGTVMDYLSFGVVPSRLIIGYTAVTPSGTVLLNAAYSFYLNKLDTLLDRLSTTDCDCIQCRANWAERVEMWTAKALEDVTANGYTLKISY
jgi:hypothetical protein